MATIAEQPAPAATPPRGGRPYRLSAGQYYRIVEAGILGKAPVFLWDGILVTKMTKHRPHFISQTKVDRGLFRIVPEGYYVGNEQPIELSGARVPEPDISVVCGAMEDYPQDPPKAKDAPLVVEVADTSLAEDWGEVLEGYARAAIPVYWIVNLVERRVEVYTDPVGATYGNRRDFGPGDAVPVVIDGREVGRLAVQDILP